MLGGCLGFLRGPQHPVVVDASGPQLLADHPSQGTALGFGDVPDAEQGGVQLVAGPKGRENGDLSGDGGLDQVQFAGHQVDTIHNVVVLCGKEGLPVLGLVLFHPDRGAALGIDVGDAVCHGLGLGHAQGGQGGLHLTVQVGESHLVMVDESEGPHAGAGQGLGAPAAHAAQAEYRHMGGGQALHSLVAQQHLGA